MAFFPCPGNAGAHGKADLFLIHNIFQKYVGKIYPALSEPETARQKPGHGRKNCMGIKQICPEHREKGGYKMTTKEKLLTLFEKNKGVYFSGEEIADKLSVSRTAVWKAVNSLRKEGYKIHAAQNKGYCLAANTDILSVQGIQKYLESSCSQIKLTVLPAAASTNALLREKARRRSAGGLCAHRRFPDRRPRADRTEVLFSPGHRALYEPSSAPLPLSGAEGKEVYHHGGCGSLPCHRISL